MKGRAFLYWSLLIAGLSACTTPQQMTYEDIEQRYRAQVRIIAEQEDTIRQLVQENAQLKEAMARQNLSTVPEPAGKTIVP